MEKAKDKNNTVSTKSTDKTSKKVNPDSKKTASGNENNPKTAKKKPSTLKRLGGFLLAKMVRGGAAELRSNAEEVNQLNVFPVPDGDTGDNMSMTIESGVAAIENLDTDDLAEVMRVLSHGMLLGARGNSGVILSQFFAGVASGFENSAEADPKTLGAALELGVKQAYSTVMTPTEGTILTVAREAVEYAVSKITPKTTIKSFFNNFVNEMHASVERTPELLPALKDAGVVDSGGAGLFYIMDGFNRVLNGEDVVAKCEGCVKEAPKAHVPSMEGFGPDSEMSYAYCTELLVQLTAIKAPVDSFDVNALRSFLGEIGDSVVAFKTDSIVKLHVHTYTPNKALEYMLKYGEFITVKIENMSLQHTELTEKKDEVKAQSSNAKDENGSHLFTKTEAKKEKPIKKYGVVSVTNGEGINALFRELGADETVNGGQTNNPSANDFLEAFKKIRSEYIFVFPNNSNIFLAAEQAASMYEEAKVYVIPTKSIGTGYVALSTMDFESPDPESIVEAASEAIAGVTSGYISPAIRDTCMDGFNIKEGDTIGIVDKKIVVDAPSQTEAAIKLAKLLLDGRFMLTIFFGKDACAEDCLLLEERIKSENPDAEIYAIDAGQEIYPYIFVAE